MPVVRSSSSFVLLVLAGLLWGTGGITGRELANSTGLSAGAIAAYRLGLGGALLVAVQFARRRPTPRGRPQWARIGAVAALAAVFQSAYFAAVAAGTVSAATLITIGSAPIFVVAAEAIGSRKRPGTAVVRPVVFGVVGLALLIGAPAGGASLASSLGGATLAAISGAAFAGFTVLGRRPLVDIDEQSVAGYGFLVGGAALALATAPFATLRFPTSAHNVGLLALFATAPTALAYTLFLRGLRGASAATATVVALLEPLTATVLAIALLGDRLTALGALGAVLLLASVLDAGRTQVRSPRVSAPIQ
jgi:DME family drug/metabolite transporter